MKRSLADRLAEVLVLVPFALAIGYLCWVKQVPFESFIFGSGSWGFGCILKLLLYQVFIRRLRPEKVGITTVSLLNGLVSGVTELGLAVAIFAFLQHLSFLDLLAFGIGIGTIEAVIVIGPTHPLKGTDLEQPVAQLQAAVDRLTGPRRLLYAHALPIAERLIAAVFHIGTRGLAYISYRTANPLPIALALLGFVLADGLIGYRLLQQGKLSNLAVLNKFYIAFLGLAGLALAGFLYFWSPALGR